MSEKAIRWGICAAGKICNDFALNLVSLPDNEHQIKAIASSSKDRAQQFAEKFGIPRFYGTYEELAKDEGIDVVYIGSVNTQHYEQTKMMLNGGKAVLCEKPLCLSPKESAELFDFAKKKNLFLMEGIWSRCFPAYAAVQKAIDASAIGDVTMIRGTFGIYLPPEDMSHRVMNRDLGGGALFDLGIYLIQLCQFVCRERPTEMIGTGFLNSHGVDNLMSITMKYPGNKLACMACSSVSEFSNDVTIYGTKGAIKIHKPFWCPAAITVNGEVQEFPLPAVRGEVIFTHSQGLSYEAQEVRRCLLNSLLESPLVTHSMSMEIAEITEKLRKDVGYLLPNDD